MAKSVNVEKFKGRKKSLTVRCKKCEGKFSILLDFRAAFRKNVHLDGSLKKSGSDKWHKIVVRDISHISRTGIRIVCADDLKEGDNVKVKFTLNNAKRSEIERDAVVKWRRDKDAGLELMDNPLYDSELGFYFLSIS